MENSCPETSINDMSIPAMNVMGWEWFVPVPSASSMVRL